MLQIQSILRTFRGLGHPLLPVAADLNVTAQAHLTVTQHHGDYMTGVLCDRHAAIDKFQPAGGTTNLVTYRTCVPRIHVCSGGAGWGGGPLTHTHPSFFKRVSFPFTFPTRGPGN